MRLLVINNKSSGLGDNAIYDFLRIIISEGDEAVIRTVSPGCKMETLVADAESFDFVVASGGDGTVTSVCYALRYRDVPVLPFPAGTGNLLSTNLSSPTEPRAIAEMAKARNIEQYDLAELEFTDESGEHRIEGFSIMAGAGYDAMIMGGANGYKSMFGQGAYYLSALMTERPQKAKITLTIDGERYTTSGIAVILVNFAKISPDLAVTHVNDAQDGLLEAVVLKADRRLQLAPALFAAFLDRRGQHPSRTDAMEIYAGHEIEIEASPALPIQFDGEIAHAMTPMRARSLPKALTAIIDEEEIARLQMLKELDGEE
ncbi:MAG: diacylglycerol/lipid kinase family protein [Coriobacteriales bacterium]|jgi:diacylglycerol kinase family enzyme